MNVYHGKLGQELLGNYHYSTNMYSVHVLLQTLYCGHLVQMNKETYRL